MPPARAGSAPARRKLQCSGGFAIFIDKGSYGNVSLDGLGAAFMGASKAGTTMMESIGDWDFVTIYIDEKANPEQRKALEAIVRETAPPAAPPERTRVAYVPITRKIEGSGAHRHDRRRTAGSPRTCCRGEWAARPRSSIPRAPIRSTRSISRASRRSRPTPTRGKKWDWSNSNYMYGTFYTDSDEYAKFYAAMMQEMEKQKARKN